MSRLEIADYTAKGWVEGSNPSLSSRHYCEQLERGAIVFFREPPFHLSSANRRYLVNQPQNSSRLHKNISYRPVTKELRGFGGRGENESRLREVLRSFSEQAANFVGNFLRPYRGGVSLDYASFRPLEEKGRSLPLHKRNDLLHIDAFPSRPTYGGRILRVFTNIHPEKSRIWLTAGRFPELAKRYAREAGLERIANSETLRKFMRGLRTLGFPVPDRSAYDDFMLRFHDFLKENSDFQRTELREIHEFPPMATWLVFTDGVPHAALAGQFALEQTFIVSAAALVSPHESPSFVLERMCGRKLA